MLDYEFPQPYGSRPLLDLGAVDLDADGLVDLVASFDVLQRDRHPGLRR